MKTATPERLLEAAETEFAAVGLEAAKLADIASRAGIRRSSLLYHFRSKEELYAATVERSFSRLRGVLVDAMQTRGAFTDRLDATVERFSEFLSSAPNVARIVMREMLAAEGPGQSILLEQIVPLLKTVERFVREQGEGTVRADVPVRAAILQVASDTLLRCAVGAMREPLWGPRDHTLSLARILLLKG